MGLVTPLAVVRALLVLTCGVCLSANQLLPEIPTASNETYLGFTFVPGDCELGRAYCDIRKPKDWTSTEIAVIKQAIDAVMARPGGPAIIERAQAKGYRTLRRYALGASRENQIPAERPLWDAQTNYPSASIDFNDRLFRGRDGMVRDRFSGNPGYLLIAKTFLHECFHAIDEWSPTEEFAILAGFVNGVWRAEVDTKRQLAAFDRLRIQMRERRDAGELDAAWHVSRQAALFIRPVRIPSLESTQGPGEAFAEIGAHLILDDLARNYLSPDVVAFFDEHVLR
jgi:hypothetical protein